MERAAAQGELSDLRDRIWEMNSGADDAERRARDETDDLSRRMHDALAAERRSQVHTFKLLVRLDYVLSQCHG